MKKIDPTVKKETKYVFFCSAALSLVMEGIFILVGAWTWQVLFGNLLGLAAAVAHFFLMGLTVQSALDREDQERRNLMKYSQGGRLLLLIVVAAIGYLAPCFELAAVVIPFLFPHFSVLLHPIFFQEK